MTIFLNRFYKNAFKDGQEEAGGLNSYEVKNVLLSIKGIGEKRAEQICEALNMKMDDEQTLEYLCGECHKDLSGVKGAMYCPYCGAELSWE